MLIDQVRGCRGCNVRSMATDADILKAVLKDERLKDDERDAFQDMLDGLTPGKKLSRKQREWAESRWKEFELDSDEALNLMSSGQVPRGKEVKMAFEGKPLPKKPPRRPSD